MGHAANGDYAAKLELYQRLVGTLPGVERKGDAVPYTAVNGHMFSYFAKSGELALRLPDPEREAFLKHYQTTLCEQYGIVQKEYVMVPAALLSQTTELKAHFAVSFNYASSLRPKSGTKGKKEKRK